MFQQKPHSDGSPKIVVVAGMPRSGTTMLHHVLDDHPNIFVPFRKETAYFTFQYERGLRWYQSLFGKMRPGCLGFDVSGNYILVEDSIQRIIDFNPETRVIVSVRDPAEVVISFYRLMYNWDANLPPFESFLDKYTYRFCHHRLELEWSSGLLTRMLGDYREAFGDNLLLIDFTLFKENLLEVMHAIELFANIPSYYSPHNLQSHRINASNRLNSPRLSHWLSQEHVISMFYAYYPETMFWFPDRSLRYLRKRLDRMRVRRGDANRGGPQVSAEHTRLARERFAAETEYVSKLFDKNRILLGSGKAFIG